MSPKSLLPDFCPSYAFILLTTVMVFSIWACSDDVTAVDSSGEESCAFGEVWHPIESRCVPDDNGGGGGGADDAGLTDPESDTGGGNGEEDTGPECVGLECQQTGCSGQQTTSISGIVNIPSGELPLPDVDVYIPNSPVAPITQGATCEQCDSQLTGNPLVHTTTAIDGTFMLSDVPVSDEIPLVIQVGKWRRELTITGVEPCQDNPITDTDRTRLPRNQQEGDMPSMAVTTGGWDALECLLRKIGIDDSEFTTEDGDGRVNLFYGHGGTNRFDNSLNNGANFTAGWDWWDDLDNLLEYDIVLHSCEGANFGEDKSQQARQTLQDFSEAGGRVFLSHLHNIWLRDGPADFGSVADWNGGSINESETGLIDASFPKGEMLYAWMSATETGTTPAGQFPINEARATIGNLNEEIAQQWVWVESAGDPFFGIGAGEHVQYFSFNTPVNAPESQQCGRVVFSDIHVSADDDSSESNPFPTGCSAALTAQERALVFMLFDLSRCIIPDGKKPPTNP